MDITLRPLQPGDEAFLYKLYCSVREDELAAVDWDAAAKEAFLQMQFGAQQAHYQTQRAYADYKLIYHADQPVGQWFIDREEENIHLLDISLLAQYRNCGIGTALIGQLVAEADADAKTATLYVHTDSPALRLYQRFGFEIVQPAGLYYFMQRAKAYCWTASTEISAGSRVGQLKAKP
jgi:ribosomal protein S18 acetylase RimI-like enzyme